MSRNKYYDEDDMYDYDDDDYDDDNYYSPQPKVKPKQPVTQSKTTTKTTNKPKSTTAVSNSATSTKSTTNTNANSQVITGASLQKLSINSPSSTTENEKITLQPIPPSVNYFSDDETLTSSHTEVRLQAITIVIAGHVDAGKSTLLGNLLYKLGDVPQRLIHKYQKQSTQIGKGSFALAWVMDESQSERDHGVTINIAERFITTNKRRITLIDCPGHSDFVPAMIRGAGYADIAVLVVPATTGEYETAISTQAQTIEHAQLLYSLGVEKIIVVVNKMDMTQPIPWNQERFNMIENTIRTLLINIHYNNDNIFILPVSGMYGDNLITCTNATCTWYTGPSLLDYFNDIPIGTFSTTTKNIATTTTATTINTTTNRGTTNTSISTSSAVSIEKKEDTLRAVIDHVSMNNNDSMDISIIILRGCITINRSVGIPLSTHSPSTTNTITSSNNNSRFIETSSAITSTSTTIVANTSILTSTENNISSSSISSSSTQAQQQVICQVKKIIDHRTNSMITTASVGDRVTLTVTSKSSSQNLSELNISEGMVLYRGVSLLKSITSFYAIIHTLNTLSMPILPGSSFELYSHGCECLAYIKTLIRVYNTEEEAMNSIQQDLSDAYIVKSRIKCLSVNKYAIVEIQCNPSIVMEIYQDFTCFGRFILRNKGKTCAVGKCTQLL